MFVLTQILRLKLPMLLPSVLPEFGLCRTEHMFFEGNRIDTMRQMILADNEVDRRKALKKLLPYPEKRFFKESLKLLQGVQQLSVC